MNYKMKLLFVSLAAVLSASGQNAEALVSSGGPVGIPASYASNAYSCYPYANGQLGYIGFYFTTASDGQSLWANIWNITTNSMGQVLPRKTNNSDGTVSFAILPANFLFVPSSALYVSPPKTIFVGEGTTTSPASTAYNFECYLVSN